MAKSNTKLHEAIKSMDIAEINIVLAAAQEQLRLRLITERRELAAAWVKQAAALDATPEEILKYESSPLPVPVVASIRKSLPINRETVLQVLQNHRGTPLSVNEVCEKLNWAEDRRPAVAYYLKKLVEEKAAKRVGKYREYRYHA